MGNTWTVLISDLVTRDRLSNVWMAAGTGLSLYVQTRDNTAKCISNAKNNVIPPPKMGKITASVISASEHFQNVQEICKLSESFKVYYGRNLDISVLQTSKRLIPVSC